MENPLSTNKDYQEYVNKKSPNSPIFKNCFHAFIVGGLICTIGQLISSYCMYRGMNQESAGTVVSIILIFLSAFLTALNIFNKIGKFAGAGSLVPITGFANGVAAPAIEFQKEGQVFGIGCKIFTIAGPVILYGIFTSWVLGFIYWIGKCFGWF